MSPIENAGGFKRVRSIREHTGAQARRRFIAAVAAPVAMLALGLTATVFYALNSAANQADQVSLVRQGQAARLAAVCYAIDTIEVALEVAGIKGRKVDVSNLIAKLIYVTWISLRARVYKRSFFETFVEKTAPKKRLKGKEGVVDLLSKVSDVFLFMFLALVYFDILKIKVGSGLSSIFALGGAGTFVFTLACQDLSKNALNGFALSASDSFQVGDSIVLGDGERVL